VSYGIDASVDAVEMAPGDPIADRPRTQPCAFELLPRSQAVLALGYFRDGKIRRVDFLTHVGT